MKPAAGVPPANLGPSEKPPLGPQGPRGVKQKQSPGGSRSPTPTKRAPSSGQQTPQKGPSAPESRRDSGASSTGGGPPSAKKSIPPRGKSPVGANPKQQGPRPAGGSGSQQSPLPPAASTPPIKKDPTSQGSERPPLTAADVKPSITASSANNAATSKQPLSSNAAKVVPATHETPKRQVRPDPSSFTAASPSSLSDVSGIVRSPQKVGDSDEDLNLDDTSPIKKGSTQLPPPKPTHHNHARPTPIESYNPPPHFAGTMEGIGSASPTVDPRAPKGQPAPEPGIKMVGGLLGVHPYEDQNYPDALLAGKITERSVPFSTPFADRLYPSCCTVGDEEDELLAQWYLSVHSRQTTLITKLQQMQHATRSGSIHAVNPAVTGVAVLAGLSQLSVEAFVYYTSMMALIMHLQRSDKSAPKGVGFDRSGVAKGGGGDGAAGSGVPGRTKISSHSTGFKSLNPFADLGLEGVATVLTMDHLREILMRCSVSLAAGGGSTTTAMSYGAVLAAADGGNMGAHAHIDTDGGASSVHHKNVPYTDDLKCLQDWMGRKRRHGTAESFFTDRFGPENALERKLPHKDLVSYPPKHDQDATHAQALARRLGRAEGHAALPDPVREHSHLRFGLEGFHLDKLVSDTSVLAKKKYQELRSAEEDRVHGGGGDGGALHTNDGDGRSSKATGRVRGNSGVSFFDKRTDLRSDRDSKVTTLQETERHLLKAAMPRLCLTDCSLCTASQYEMYHDHHHSALGASSLPPPPPPTYYKAVYYAQYLTLPDPILVIGAIRNRQMEILRASGATPPANANVALPALNPTDLHNVYVSLTPHYLRRPDPSKAPDIENIIGKLKDRVQGVKDERIQHMHNVLTEERKMRTRTLQEWRDKKRKAEMTKKKESALKMEREEAGSSRLRSKTRIEEEMKFKKEREEAAVAGESLAQMLTSRAIPNSKKFRRTPVFRDLADMMTTGFLPDAAQQHNQQQQQQGQKPPSSAGKKGNHPSAQSESTQSKGGSTETVIENTLEGLYRALIIELQEEKRKRFIRYQIIRTLMKKKEAYVWAKWGEEEIERSTHKSGSRYGAAGAYFHPYTQGTHIDGQEGGADTYTVPVAKLIKSCARQEEQRVLSLIEHRLHVAKRGIANYVTRELLLSRGSTQLAAISAAQAGVKLSAAEQFEQRGDAEEGAKSRLLLTRRVSDVYQNLDDLVDRNMTVAMDSIWIDEVGGDLLVDPDEVCEEALRLLFIHAFGVFEPTKVADVQQWIPKVIKEKASSVWGVTGALAQNTSRLHSNKMTTEALNSLSRGSGIGLAPSPLLNSADLVGSSQNPIATMLHLMSQDHHQRQDAYAATLGYILGKWSLKKRSGKKTLSTGDFMQEIEASVKYALHNEQNRKASKKARKQAERKSKVANHAIWEAMQDMTSSDSDQSDGGEEDGNTGDLIIAMLPNLEQLSDSLTDSTSNNSDPLVELGEDSEEAEERDKQLEEERFKIHLEERRKLLDGVEDDAAEIIYDMDMKQQLREFQSERGKFLDDAERRERAQLRRRLVRKRQRVHYRNSTLSFVKQISSFDAMMSDNSVAVTHAIIDISKAYGRLPMANELHLLFKKDLRTRLSIFYAQTNPTMLQENNIGTAAQAYHVQDNEAYIKARRRAAAEEENGSLSYDPMAALTNKGPEPATSKAVLNARKHAAILDNYSTHGAQAMRVQLMEGAKVDRLLVSYVGRENLLEETAFEKYCSLYFPKAIIIRRRDGLLMQNIFSSQRRLMGLQDSRARGSSANFLDDLGVPTNSPLRQLGQLPYTGAPDGETRVVRPEEATIDDLLLPFLLPSLPNLPQQPQKLFGNWKLITDEATRIDGEHRRREVRQQKKNLLEKKRMGTLTRAEAAELNSMIMTRKRTVREANSGLPEDQKNEPGGTTAAMLIAKKKMDSRAKKRGFGSSSSSGSLVDGVAGSLPAGAIGSSARGTSKVTEWLEKGGPAAGQTPGSPPSDLLTKPASKSRHNKGIANNNIDANLEELEKFMVPTVAAEMKNMREAALAARNSQVKPAVDRSRKARRERKAARIAAGLNEQDTPSTSNSDSYFYHSSSIDSVLEARGGKPLSPSEEEVDSDFDSVADSIPMIGNKSRVVGGVHQRKRYYGDDVPSLKQLDEEERIMQAYYRTQQLQSQKQQRASSPDDGQPSPDSLNLDSLDNHHPEKPLIHNNSRIILDEDEEDSLQLDDEDFRKIFSSISQHFDPSSLHPSLRTKHLQRRKEQHSKELREDIARQVASRRTGSGHKGVGGGSTLSGSASPNRSLAPSNPSSPRRSRRESGAIPLPSNFDASDLALL